MSSNALIIAFYDDRIYTFAPAERWSASAFGGPMPGAVSGRPFGLRPLHLIACLGGRHIPALSGHHLTKLPLIYGMYYDGCWLTYRIEGAGKIELLGIDPALSSDDWPYPNFPPLLPYVPLRLEGGPQRGSYDKFASRFPNMPEQQTADLIVAVPPPANVGLSLWGDGDADEVTIVFECDLKKREVRASNVVS